MSRRTRAIVVTLAALVAGFTPPEGGPYVAPLAAHSGPPFPIVTDAARGPYTISVWTDPDATDDGAPGGQFWIVIASAARGVALPEETRASLSVRPIAPPPESRAQVQTTRAEPVRGDVGNQFGAVLMDHEGPFAVHVEVIGPLGQAVVDSMVDATYDLRPPPYMLIWYLVPFLLAGFLWTRLLLRRRAVRAGGRGPSDTVHVP